MANTRDILSNAIQDLLFSVSQGYQAQSQGRGAAGRSAGIGAALGGASLRRQIQDQQSQDDEERQVKIQQIRQLLLQGRQQEARQLAATLQGSVGPVSVQGNVPVMPSPVRGNPAVMGTPESGLTVPDQNGEGLQPGPGQSLQFGNLPSVSYPTDLNGGSVPIPVQSQQQLMQQARQAALDKAGIDLQSKLLEPSNLSPGQRRMSGQTVISEGAPVEKNIDPNSTQGQSARLAYESALRKLPPMPSNTQPGVDQQEMADWLRKHPGKGPSDYGEYKMRFTNQLTQQNQQGAVKNVAPHLVATASADAIKAGQAYADAQNAADDMTTFIDLAKSGNVQAYAYAPTEGVLTLNTSRGVKRVNMAEISSYGGAGSALDRIKAFFGKATAGASIPKNVLEDMQSLHDAVAKNAKTGYARKLKVVNQTYGSTFEPIEFGGPTSDTGERIRVQGPNGQSGTQLKSDPVPTGWKVIPNG